MNLKTQLLTQNSCYKAGQTMTPRGIMVHSTGANNPNLCRYVPGNSEIGRNLYGNHWDMAGVGACVHAFIGKMANGSIATVQTLPWEMRGWHCALSGNDTHISFELCEDDLTDGAYFAQIYQEAVELTAMLCLRYDLDPMTPGVVVSHAEGHRLGIASNHADVGHWFPRHGKNMDQFRKDVNDMTEYQMRQIIRDELARAEQERAELPASPWAVEGKVISRAAQAGISDGTRPRANVTREECMAMVLAAVGE